MCWKRQQRVLKPRSSSCHSSGARLCPAARLTACPPSTAMPTYSAFYFLSLGKEAEEALYSVLPRSKEKG